MVHPLFAPEFAYQHNMTQPVMRAIAESFLPCPTLSSSPACFRFQAPDVTQRMPKLRRQPDAAVALRPRGAAYIVQRLWCALHQGPASDSKEARCISLRRWTRIWNMGLQCVGVPRVNMRRVSVCLLYDRNSVLSVI